MEPFSAATPDIQQSYARLSQYATHLHSIVGDVDVEQLEWYLDALYLEYSKIRDDVSTISWDLFHGSYNDNGGGRWSIGNAVSSPSLEFSQKKSSGFGSTRSSVSALSVTVRGSDDQDQWPLSNDKAGPNITPEGDPVRRLRLDLERIVAGHRRWLVKVCKEYDQGFTPEELDSVKFCADADKYGLVKSLALSEGKSLHNIEIWEKRFKQYSKLKRDAAELKSLTPSKKPSTTRLRRVVLETIAPYGDAILEFSNTRESDDGEAPILRFRVSSHMLTECSPTFARMFSKHPNVLNTIPPLDVEQELPQHPVQFTEPDGSTIQLWRMPQVETNKESSLTILLHAAHMHNEHVPRTIPFEQLVALSEAAIRYRCAKPLELFFEHCWLHQWIHKASEDMPDGLVTISYAFGRRRLFSRVTKSVVLHLTDEEELRSKSWPQVVKDKIWAVRSAKMAQVYATCSETIEEYLRRPRASSAIPVSPLTGGAQSGTSPKLDSTWSWRANSQIQGQQVPPVPPSPVAAEQQLQPKSPAATKSKKDSWNWRPLSSNKLPPVGSPQRPISRPVILPPPPPPPVTINHRQTRSIDSTSSNNSASTGASIPNPFPSELFSFTSAPRCPKGSHWCDATNLGWLLLVYNELRLFSAILGPSALTGLSLSPNTAEPAGQPRSLAKVLDALRGMANPPHPVHSGGPCDPVPAFRDAVNDIYNSVTGLALQEVDGQGLRHRLGLSMPKLHLGADDRLFSVTFGGGQIAPSSREEIIVSTAGQGADSNENFDLNEDIAIGRDEALVSPFFDQNTSPKMTPTQMARSTAPTRALTEEGICLNILRHLETREDLRAVAILNHRTYNIYKTHEASLVRDMVLGGRIQSMMQLTANQLHPNMENRRRAPWKFEEADESYNSFKKSRYQSQGAVDAEQQHHLQQHQNDPFSSHILLSPDLMRTISNLADDPEGASTRAIKRASSEASSAASCSSVCFDVDDDDMSDSDWNLASGELSHTQTVASALDDHGDSERRRRATSFCPSLDITEGLNTASILQSGTADTATRRVSSLSTLKPRKDIRSRNTLSGKYRGGENKKKAKETPARSSWLDEEADSDSEHDPTAAQNGNEPPEYDLQSRIEKERDSDFYSINEQEAYRILWPDEASIKSGKGPASSSMPRAMSQAFGPGINIANEIPAQDGNGNTGDDYIYGHYQDTAEEENEPPQVKYSRQDGSWLALKGAQIRALVGVGVGTGTKNIRISAIGTGSSSNGGRTSLEAKSLTLLTASNGNNKILTEEFDQQQRRRTTPPQQVEIGLMI